MLTVTVVRIWADLSVKQIMINSSEQRWLDAHSFDSWSETLKSVGYSPLLSLYLDIANMKPLAMLG